MTSCRDQEELTVITKTYDLILWSCNHTGKFPRNHRFVLGERIERASQTHPSQTLMILVADNNFIPCPYPPGANPGVLFIEKSIKGSS